MVGHCALEVGFEVHRLKWGSNHFSKILKRRKKVPKRIRYQCEKIHAK